jgi:molybdopterin biosynthesis enzyme
MVLADGLMILPPSETRYEEGARVKVQLLHTDSPLVPHSPYE